MSFTYADIGRLKETLGFHKSNALEILTPNGIEKFDLTALVARLEAAEEMLPFFINEHKRCPNPNCVVFKQVEAWRKACGK